MKQDQVVYIYIRLHAVILNHHKDPYWTTSSIINNQYVVNIFYFQTDPWGNDPNWRAHIFQMGGSTTNQLKMDPERDAGSVGPLCLRDLELEMLTLSIWCDVRCVKLHRPQCADPKSLDLQVFVGKASFKHVSYIYLSYLSWSFDSSLNESSLCLLYMLVLYGGFQK